MYFYHYEDIFIKFSSCILHRQFDDGNLGVKMDEHLVFTTYFGCNVKIRSIEDKEFSKTCAGSFMIWWSQYCEVTNSIFATFVVVLSLIYQFLDFISKSLSTAINCELDSARISKVSPKLSVNFSKPSLVWPGDP